jgi:motility quorum-sensing regulator/GCU-specific mRNA interferase toxin
MSCPTYDLNTIQEYVRSGLYRITLSAKQGAVALGMDTSDIETCVLGLTPKDFYKTMEAKKLPGIFQDVYRPIFGRCELYLKLQITSEAVVISFKQR